MVGSILVILSSASVDTYSLHHSSGISVLSDATPFSNHLIGCVLALFSSASSGLTTVLFQKFQITDSELYLSISGVSGIGYLCLYLTVNKLVYSFESLTLVSTDQVSPVVYMLILNGVVSSVIGYFLYIEAINRLKSATTVNVLFALSIPLTVLIDYYRGQVHAVTPSFLIGALLVIASTILVPLEQEPLENLGTLSREFSTIIADPVLCQDIPLLVFEDTDDNSSN
jgi:drug/metabolite transporter (DMT)-like permease